MLVELLIFLITIALFISFLHQKPKGIPPGEWGLPIVGYVPFLNWKISETLKILEKKHGKIFCLKLGVRTFIVIGDYSLIKEAYNKTETSGRPSVFNYNHMVKYGHLGIITSNGHIWNTNRRFALKTLKDFGMGKSKLEEFVLGEAECLVKELEEFLDKPFRVEWSLNTAVVNVIWRIVANHRYNINDKEVNEFSQDINESFRDTEGPMALLVIFPWLLPFLPNFIKNNWMKIGLVAERRDKFFSHILKIIEDHKKTLDLNNARDYIDAYLIELEQQKDKPEYAHWGDKDLLVSVYEFFVGGSDTTSTTLRWFFLYMAKYPHIQKRVQDEIDRVMPRDKLPTFQDKNRLPCLQALSYEIGRVVSLLPNAVPHEVVKEISIGGYRIPKGSIVVPNIESIHTDPNLWSHPNEFSIDNFLDENGIFVSKEGFISFSIGRRICPGEHLAKMELFIFMGAILQNFSVFEPLGENISLSPDQSANVFNYPKNYNILLKKRI